MMGLMCGVGQMEWGHFTVKTGLVVSNLLKADSYLLYCLSVSDKVFMESGIMVLAQVVEKVLALMKLKCP